MTDVYEQAEKKLKAATKPFNDKVAKNPKLQEIISDLTGHRYEGVDWNQEMIEVVKTSNPSNRTIISVAVSNMLKAGIDPNFKTADYEDQKIKQGNVGEGDTRTFNGHGLGHILAACVAPKTFTEWAKKGGNVNQATLDSGETPAHKFFDACKTDDVKVADANAMMKAMKELGVKIDTKDKSGKLPIQHLFATHDYSILSATKVDREQILKTVPAEILKAVKDNYGEKAINQAADATVAEVNSAKQKEALERAKEAADKLKKPSKDKTEQKDSNSNESAPKSRFAPKTAYSPTEISVCSTSKQGAYIG